ncbi:MAG: NDP-sugar synthase [Oscillatoriales cyanobacterium SM2_2_1]|nr:NDP-sugar synthase [Oscillatoriales cyanobacterium SM2_2_1]
MQAVIIAGGKGTRLRPLTYGCPKPMLPLFHRPFLDWMVERCRLAGITDILLNIHYQGQQVKDYFGAGDRHGVMIRYIEEAIPLDTAGALKLAEPFFTGESLVVFNADILTDLDLTALTQFHQQQGSDVTLTLTRVADITPFGLVELGEGQRVVAFREKPSPEEAIGFLAQGINTINAGTYVIEPHVFAGYGVGEPLSFERVVFPNVLQRGQAMTGFVWDGYWLDVGSPAKYYQSHLDILRGAMPYNLEAQDVYCHQEGIWIAKTAQVSPRAVLEAPCYVGSYATVTDDAYIPGGTIVGAYGVIQRAIAPGIYREGCLL